VTLSKAAKNIGDMHKRSVAEIMTKSVVQSLEMIDVAYQYGCRVAGVPGRLKRGLGRFVEAAPIQYAGQLIGMSDNLKLAAGLPQVMDKFGGLISDRRTDQNRQ
jgi:hypothetical protein